MRKDKSLCLKEQTEAKDHRIVKDDFYNLQSVNCSDDGAEASLLFLSWNLKHIWEEDPFVFKKILTLVLTKTQQTLHMTQT